MYYLTTTTAITTTTTTTTTTAAAWSITILIVYTMCPMYVPRIIGCVFVLSWMFCDLAVCRWSVDWPASDVG